MYRVKPDASVKMLRDLDLIGDGRTRHGTHAHLIVDSTAAARCREPERTGTCGHARALIPRDGSAIRAGGGGSRGVHWCT